MPAPFLASLAAPGVSPWGSAGEEVKEAGGGLESRPAQTRARGPGVGPWWRPARRPNQPHHSRVWARLGLSGGQSKGWGR